MKTKVILALAILLASLSLPSCEEVIIEPTQPYNVDVWEDRSDPSKGYQPRKEADRLYDRHD